MQQRFDKLMDKVDSLGQVLSSIVTGDSHVETPIPEQVAARTAALTRSRAIYRGGTYGGLSASVALGLLVTHLLAYIKGTGSHDDAIEEHGDKIVAVETKIDAQAVAQAALLGCERKENRRLELELGRMNRLHALQWAYTTSVYDAIASKKRPPPKPIDLMQAELDSPIPPVRCDLLDARDDSKASP